MSLINQVLTDLEKRRSREGAAADGLLLEVRTAPPRRKNLAPMICRALLALLLLAAVLLVALALRHGSPAEQEPVKTAAVRMSVPTADLPSAEPNEPPAAAVYELPEQAAKTAAPASVAPAGNADMESSIASGGEKAQPGRLSAVTAPAGHSQQEQPEKTVPRDTPVAAEPVPKEPSPASAAPMPQSRPAPGGTLRVVHPLTPREEAERELRQGREAISAGRWAEGETALRRVIALVPDHLKGRELLADALLSRGRAGEAEEVLRQGLQIAPFHPPFLKGYARLLAGRGAWEEAGELLHRAEPPLLSIDPDFHALLAAVYQRRGDFSAAADIYRKLVQLRPANGTWWVGLGIALEGGKMTEKAQEAFVRGLEAGGMSPELAAYARGRLAAIRN